MQDSTNQIIQYSKQDFLKTKLIIQVTQLFNSNHIHMWQDSTNQIIHTVQFPAYRILQTESHSEQDTPNQIIQLTGFYKSNHTGDRILQTKSYSDRILKTKSLVAGFSKPNHTGDKFPDKCKTQ